MSAAAGRRYPGVGRQPQRDGGKGGGTLDGEARQRAVSQQHLVSLKNMVGVSSAASKALQPHETRAGLVTQAQN